MEQKRLRIFAGPNGSGKSSIINELPSSASLGYYINADEIEKQIVSNGELRFLNYGIHPDINRLRYYLLHSSFVKEKSTFETLNALFSIDGGLLKIKRSSPGYTAAIISDFIRQESLANGHSFSFETVMSHSGKAQLIEQAVALGYKVYLYFICTDNYLLNIERVKARVMKGGHDVAPEKIEARYFRCLSQLLNVMKLCYKSYLFDNSGDTPRLIARVNRDRVIHLQVPEADLPGWYVTHVINKLQ